jgi:hypothetical protein
MMFFKRSLLMLGLVALVGCDAGPVSAPPEDVDDTSFELRLMLEDAVETGRLAADFADSEDIVAEIKAEDAAKGAELEADIKELQAMSDPEQIKAKAKEVLGKL